VLGVLAERAGGGREVPRDGFLRSVDRRCEARRGTAGSMLGMWSFEGTG